MPETTFACPDLTTFLGLDALGLTAVGQHLTAKHAVIECRMPIGFEDPFCKACGAQGVSRGTVVRRLAHVPVGWSERRSGFFSSSSPGPRAGGVETHATGGAPAALRMYPLPPGVEAGHLYLG